MSAAKTTAQRQAELKARRALQGLKRRSVYATDAEWAILRAGLEMMRSKHPTRFPDAV